MSVIIVCEVRGKGRHRKGVIYSVRYADFTPCVPDLRQRVSFNHNIDVICKFKFSHQLIKWYISDVYQTVGPALDCFGVIYMLHDEMIVLHTYHLVRTQDIYLVGTDLVRDFYRASQQSSREVPGLPVQTHVEPCPEDTVPEAHIFQSVKNRCLNHLRDKANRLRIRQQMHDDTYKAIMTEIGVLGKDEIGLIFRSDIMEICRNLLASIPESSRDIFLSSRFENLTYNEIAEKYNITPRKVKREIQHVLEIMRTSLKDYLPLLILLYVISGKLN